MIRFLDALDADESDARPGAQSTRHARDRALGRRLERAAPVEQLMAWLAERRGGGAHDGAPGTASSAAACAMLGAALGVATALGTFYYDGGTRVNVLLVLAVFVGLPLLSLLAFTLVAIWGRGPVGPATGAAARALVRLLPGAAARDLLTLAAGRAGHRLARWLALWWSQWLGLGFGVGALLATLLLVVLTDLAFGWSTTLDLRAATLTEAVRTLALPWRGALPQAVPDAALVEVSRFFRLQQGAAAATDPVVLGRWWSFLVMAMLVYGVAPRALTLALSRWRLRVACREALLADPRAHALLDRMNTPLVETRSPDPEHALAPSSAAVDVGDLPAATAWDAVCWAGCETEADALGDVVSAPDHVHAAGGTRAIEEDAELVSRLAADPRGAGVLVVARAWEPPTLELMDFLTELRSALPAARPVAVLALTRAGAPTDRALETWRRAFARARLDGVSLVPGRALA